jgi:RNA recognition motif-containing protein
MSPVGKVFTAVINTTKNGKSSGRGYVEYENKDIAGRAIDTLNGTELDGRVLQLYKYNRGGQKAILGEESEAEGQSPSQDKSNHPYLPSRTLTDPPAKDCHEVMGVDKDTPIQQTFRGKAGSPLNSGANNLSEPPDKGNNKMETPVRINRALDGNLGGASDPLNDKPLSSPSMVPVTVSLKRLLENRNKFKRKLKEWGWDYHLVPGDGWCLFHAVAVAIGRAGQGKKIMEEVVDHMMKNKKDSIGVYGRQ